MHIFTAPKFKIFSMPSNNGFNQKKQAVKIPWPYFTFLKKGKTEYNIQETISAFKAETKLKFVLLT